MTELHWHADHRPVLAWLEAGVKLLGTAVGVYALWQGSTAAGAWQVGSVVALAILGALSIGTVVSTWDPWRRREVVSAVLAVLIVAGHACAFVHLLGKQAVSPPVATFAAVMVLGKISEIQVARKREGADPSKGFKIGLALLYAVGYVAIFGLSAVAGT
jgi:hypothetical protein